MLSDDGRQLAFTKHNYLAGQQPAQNTSESCSWPSSDPQSCRVPYRVVVILPVCDTDSALLRACMASIQIQAPTASAGWTIAGIVVADDGFQPVTQASLPTDLPLTVTRTPRPRSGANIARMCAVRAASQLGATHYALIDSDDTWLPRHLQGSLEVLLSKDHAAVSYSRLHGIGTFLQRMPQGLLPRELLCGNFASTQTLVVSAEVFERVGFDPSVERLQDWDFVLSAGRAGFPLYYNPEGGAMVTLTPQSVSRGSGSRSRLARSLTYICTKHLELFETEPRALVAHLKCALQHDPRIVAAAEYQALARTAARALVTTRGGTVKKSQPRRTLELG